MSNLALCFTPTASTPPSISSMQLFILPYKTILLDEKIKIE